MILALATMLVLPLLAGAPALQGASACATPPCETAIAGRWTFTTSTMRWAVDVGADGRIHAEGERSVTIGADVATYVSTLDGSLTGQGVVLSIRADRFSLPNFKPGPPTICTGKPVGAGRYEGSCASGDQRMRFAFHRE